MILLFSGGIDSYVAYHYLGKPQTLYFNLNTRYSFKEILVVTKLIPDTIIEHCINFKTREEEGTAFVPYRNLHLALLANKYSDTIVIAGVKDDKVNDKNEYIFDQFSKLMSHMMDREITVMSPFWSMSKQDVVKWFLDNGGTKAQLLSTLSCYSSDDSLFCGKCAACFRKWCALKVNGIDDLQFTNHSLMRKYFEAALRDEYSSERAYNIIQQVLTVHPEWRD
jgi:7-cyano-7-deazaguanine synthase